MLACATLLALAAMATEPARPRCSALTGTLRAAINFGVEVAPAG